MTNRKPITRDICWLRQRQRKDGSWRVWWEPDKAARTLGFQVVELDAGHTAWSELTAAQLNKDVIEAQASGGVKAPAQSRSIVALVEAYRADDSFRDLRPATKKSYTGNMGLVQQEWGAWLAKDIRKSDVRKWYLECKTTRGRTQAMALVRMLSILMTFAEDLDWRAPNSNPCLRMKMTKPAPRRRWASWAELDALRTAGDDMGLGDVASAVLLSALAGQRQTDVLAARRKDFVLLRSHAGEETWTWKLRRSKRETEGVVALHPIVAARLADRFDGTDAPLLTDPATGKPLSGDRIQKLFGRLRTEAARRCPSLTAPDNRLLFRDLRRTFGVLSRAGGAHNDDVGDVLGNSAASVPALEETYMPATFHTTRRAVMAIRRPEDDERKEA